ncbi:hypothetical protein [Actinoplanes sp. CA-252034]|uniref:hypothetical protein n=1 Tax=Actinoplanes sp. CA-252034 TaxID=3239906 RepID=UPI003D957C14
MSDADDALIWLAAQGVTRLGPGRWHSTEDDAEMSDGELAHEWAACMLGDEGRAPAERVRITLGLLDLIDEFWVTTELAFFLNPYYNGATDDQAAAQAFWAGVRARLERPSVPDQLLYTLWVEWFEDHRASERAFAEVLGDDLQRLPGDEALQRRADRVLRNSGPVPWSGKRLVYSAVAAMPSLAPALFRGILLSYHDYYGSLEPAEALALLDRLDLPPDTEHLERLRAVLRQGAHNHYRNPELWSTATDGERRTANGRDGR